LGWKKLKKIRIIKMAAELISNVFFSTKIQNGGFIQIGILFLLKKVNLNKISYDIF
jgi:hypothetical protein